MKYLFLYYLYSFVYVSGVEFSFFLESEEKLCFVDTLAPNTLLIAKVRSQTD